MTSVTQESYEAAPNNETSLRIEFQKELPNLIHAIVTIPADLVASLYKEASLSQISFAKTEGFHPGEIPIEYIEKIFGSNLIEHLEEFLFKYMVLEFLYQEIRKQKVLVVGSPRITQISIEPNKDAEFHFELSHLPLPQLQDWKYLPFKAPKRKNYKDLDRQVEMFLKDERAFFEQSRPTIVEVGDWASISVTLTTQDGQPILGNHSAQLWLKMGDEEADSSFRDLLVDQKIGQTIQTRNRSLQEYFSSYMDTNYMFNVTINDVLKHNYFCFETFKKHFKIKTNKEMFQKLIEVFSYRNDISQRRTMAEQALQLLLSKNPFTIPDYLVLRQSSSVLETIKNKPDFHVYRTQKDFKDRIRQLSTKQIKEMVFLDQLAYNEDLAIHDHDVKSYLNLINRPRMKEFIYFDPHETKVLGQEAPLPAEQLKHFCLREKTLNHIIYHLTKK